VAPVADWPTPRELTPAVAQRAFHAIMEAFSRPGTLHQLPLEAVPAGVPAVMIPLLTLADIMTPVAALPTPGQPTEDAVALAARLVVAPVAEPESTRFALAFGEPDHDVFARLQMGSHWSPETGAMLFQRVSGIGPATEGGWLLSGPGVKPGEPVRLNVGGLSDTFVAIRSELVSDYPAGIDVLLVADDGRIAALSRTTRVELEVEAR
jgi:alpha-D-ribose 1-methylphosphonate 5-triphosphate synthase subunit PhnH